MNLTQMKFLYPFRAFGICSILIPLVLLVAIASAKSAPLNDIVDALVTSFNNQDAKTFYAPFGSNLKKDQSLSQVEEILIARMNSYGPIVSHRTQLSPDGKRALVFLEMESAGFDLHVRVNNDYEVERLAWYSHKAEPSATTLSGHEQHTVRDKYQPYVDMFVEALRDANAEALMALMLEDESDDWSVEDYRAFLFQMRDRGIKEVGETEVISGSEVLIPVLFETVDMGFYLGFDKGNKISNLRISNYAPNETRGVSYTTLGSDTLRTSDLKSFDQLAGAFASDAGRVRFITLLSPT